MRHCLWLALLAGCSRGESAAKVQAPVVAAAKSEEAVKSKDVEEVDSGPYAIKVRGESVSFDSYRFQYNSVPMLFGNVPASQRKLLTLEFLIQRELLAQAAAKLKFSVSDEKVRKSIEAGDLYTLGHKVDGKKIYFKEVASGGTEFSSEYLENLVRGHLGLSSLAHFQKEQRRELMAQFMRDKIKKSETVSKKETRDFYVLQNSKVSADYLKFDAHHYRSQLRLNRAMVQGYVDTHEAQLKAEWHKVKPRWQSDEARIELRIIRVDRDLGAPKISKRKIRRARAKIRKGADFESVASETSQDRLAGLGGYVGWRAAQSIGYGSEVVTACEGLAVGEVSEVIETPRAYYLVRIEKRATRGLRFDQMKFSLAIRMAPQSIARELARKAAEAALASPLPLEKQYPETKQLDPSVDPSTLPKEIREQLTPEQIAQLAQLPAAVRDFGAPPSLRRMEGVRRDQESVDGVGYGKKLVKALWGDVAIGALVPTVLEVDDGDVFVVARIRERSEADMKAFSKQASELRNTLAEAKGDKAVKEWVTKACRALVESNSVTPSADLLLSAAGDSLPYKPCTLLME